MPCRIQGWTKKGDSIKLDKIPDLVTPSGKVSNFLLEDYEAVLKFMNAETRKMKLHL